MQATNQLMDLINTVGDTLHLNYALGGVVHWSQTSAGLPLERANDPGGYIAIQLDFECRHAVRTGL